MKVVYFGTDVFLSCFQYFVEEHEVLALYTYHNNEDYFTEQEIVAEARKHHIPVHYEDMTLLETSRLLEEGCDLFFSAEYNRIIPTLEQDERYHGINIHSSLLPEGRSYYPIEAAMERSLCQTGVTMHKMTSALDGGDILGQYIIPIYKDMDSIDIYLRCGKGAKELLLSLMADFEGGWSRARKQKNPKAYRYWKRPEREKLTLTHKRTRKEAMEMFRCYNQMVEVSIHGEEYYIRSLVTGVSDLPQEVMTIEEDRVLYALQDGHARLILQKKEDNTNEK